jgi:putative ABC transport system permease protein
VLAVGLLAAIALVATVVGGARARGRALAMLRTLGMNPRLGWWLALSELAPMVVAAVIGGIASGVVVVAALAPSLGLDLLAGGVSIPPPSISGGVLVSLVIGAVALLLIGALADVLAHRRDKLSEVLRVGDTV